MAAIKEVDDATIGDTVTDAERPTAAPLPGFKAVKPMVFSGLYPTDIDASTSRCATRWRSCG